MQSAGSGGGGSEEGKAAGVAAWARRWPALAAGLFLAGLLALAFPGAASFRQVPFVSEMVSGSDLTHFNYPMRRFLSEGLLQGRMPLWTDAINGGFPVHAEGQGGFLYPPHLLVALLPLAASINLSFLLAYAGAGVLMFLYAREIGQSRTAALFAGMVFAFSGFLFSHVRHLNVIAVAQWLPLLLLLAERYARTRRPLYLLAMAPVQALQHLAGHPQVTYYSILFTGAYLLARVAAGGRGQEAGVRRQEAGGRRQEAGGGRQEAGGRGQEAGELAGHALRVARCALRVTDRAPRHLALAALGFAAAAALGAGLAGAQLLPSWELAQLSDRPAKGSFTQATFHTLPLPHLITFVAPFALGDPGRNTYSYLWGKDAVVFWENSGYVGIIPLALALFATGALWRRNRWVALLAAAAGLALLLAMGKQTPLFPLLWRHFPGMSAFRVAGRFLLVTDLALAALAGFGLDLLRARLTAARPRWAPWALALLIAITAADLLHFGRRQCALVDARRWLAPAPAARAIAADGGPNRVFTWHATEPWLMALHHNGGWQRDPERLYPLLNALLPNHNALQGIPHFGYYSGFTLPEKGRVLGQWSGLSALDDPEATRAGLRLLGLYGVGYLVAPDDYTAAGAQPVQDFPVPGHPQPLRLYRNPYALPRAYVAARAEPAGSERQALGRLLSRAFEPRKTVVVEGAGEAPHPPAPRRGSKGAGAAEVRWVRSGAEEIVLDVDAPGGGWLVLNDYPYPGWRALVDGTPQPVFRANLVARAVPIPPGRHRVTFAYAPISWDQGLALSAVSLCVLLLGMLACRRGQQPRIPVG